MMTENILRKVQISPQDWPCIMEVDKVYGSEVEKIANKYKEELCSAPFAPYDYQALFENLKKSERIAQTVADIAPEYGYTLQLLMWLYLVPYMEQNYKDNGIDMQIFYDTVADISYKVKECKDVYGEVGVFTSWFFIEQELKLFALGRLQYDIRTYEMEDYKCGDYTLTKGDTVYSCHIPASGALIEEDCINSFKMAYDFFGAAKMKKGILPIHCESWLLYPPYIEKVYADNSNLKKFAQMFDVFVKKDSGKEFRDAWRVFNKKYEGSTDELPNDTGLRRSMIEYIKNYGVFGYGNGIILFDGEKIINRNN